MNWTMRNTFIAAALLVLLSAGSCTSEKKTALELRSEADLPGLTLAYPSGSYYQTKYDSREDVASFATNSESDAVQAVRQGDADVLVIDEVALTKDEMKRLGLKLAFRGEEFFDVAFAVQKGNTELLSQLDSFIASAPLEDMITHWTDGAPAVEEPAFEIAEDAAPLRCICCANMAPVSYVGDRGEWMGMDPDILRRFAHAIGRPFQMQYVDFAAAIIALQTGQADVMSACLFVTEERKKNVDFSIPYYQCHPGYFVKDTGNTARMGIGERLKMNLLTEARWKLIVDGLLETLKITFLSILLGTVLGIGLCACMRSRRKGLRTLAGLYGAFINGIPTLVLLLIMFYVVFAGTGVNASLVAVVTFALCFAASSGAIFDTAISSVPRGQTEAGLSLGFTPFKTFTGIVFPQAAQKGIPLYAAECVALLKSTSIVGYIAIQDITRASDLIRSRTFDALIPLLVVTILYFVLAWLIRLLLNLFLTKKI